uniref:FAE domain-containing protein n=1 Tax=Gossypium raimondii TaxID=29730 RepID=A0A0D2V811_GOSRA|nr:hypothetical protein B456_010G093900 [Gossypium raimondii]
MSKISSPEIVNCGIKSSGPNSGSLTFSVRVQRRIPDFLQSVSLKYVKLGYHYLINRGIYLATIPVLVLVFSAEVGSLSREELRKKLSEDACYDLATVLSFFTVFCIHHFCLLYVTKEQFIEMARASGKFDEASLQFQKRIVKSSGVGDETYLPKAVMSDENSATMKEGRLEASTVMFGALDELFENYNLGGMGCSAGLIAVDLARDMLQANPNNYAVVVNTEMVGYNWYPGRDRSMLVPNCFFQDGMLRSPFVELPP